MAQIKNSIFNKKKLKYQIEKVNFNDISDFQIRMELVNKWLGFVNSESFFKSKETELQGDFLFDIFGRVLGYYSKSNNPSEWNLNQEQVTTVGGKFADGSLGFYNVNGEIIRVVIELKDPNTSLDERQHRHNDNRTPVEQAFGYQHRIGKDCKWVIVSNFNEIRLYHHSSSIEFEQFFIKELASDEKLKRFFFLLGKDNLIAKEGNSLIDSLFISNEQDEQEITKKFYAAFKDIRLKFFDHLKTNNPTIDENILLEKTQKLLDRFIFICFAEDNRLLPETIFKNMVKAAKLAFSYSETKVWTELKGLFNAINIGSPPHNINKFNGGLFAADEVLDSLQIKDQILEELSNITDYDFESDVSIDILGHIFEQSISDLEEIKASINGEVFEKSKSKRKRDGIVYTPAYITRDIVEKAVGGWLEDRKVELGYYDLPELTDEDFKTIINNRGKLTYNDKIKQHLEFWYAYRERLMNIKVLDPACGSGAFLIQVFDYLLAEGNKVNDTIAKLLGGQYEVFQLDKHILSNNIYGVDINSESVEITKLSLWLKTANKNAELTSLDKNIKCGNSLIDDPEVAGDKAFDWEKEFAEIMNNGGFDVVVGNPPYGAELNKDQIKYLDNKYNLNSSTKNSAIYFISLAYELSNSVGCISYIIPKSISYSSGWNEIANIIISNLTHLIDTGEAFQDVLLEQVIFIVNLNSKPVSYISGICQNNKIILNSDIPKDIFYNYNVLLVGLNNIEFELIFNLLKRNHLKFNKYVEIKRGLNWQAKSNKDSNYTPIFRGAQLNRYYLDRNDDFIDLSAFKVDDYQYQLQNKVLNQLAIAHVKNPYPHFYLQSFYDIDKRLVFETISCTFKKDPIVDLKFIICLNNSKLFAWLLYKFIYSNAIRSTRYDEKYVGKLPIPELDQCNQQPFIPLADTMLDKNKELQEKNRKFQELLKADFNIEKLNTKLENWYNLSWSDFEQELKKLKITLSGERKEDWIERFNRYKSQVAELQNIIQTTDKKIDQLVYQLYKLTEEEIKVVEGE